MSMPENRLTGQVVALVTEASKGIGRASALALSSTGANIMGVPRTASKLEELASQVRARGGEGITVFGDVADELTSVSPIRQTMDVFGLLDILVNNAGIRS